MSSLFLTGILYFIFLLLLLGNPNMVTALAGNKADLLDARKVTAEASISISAL